MKTEINTTSAANIHSAKKAAALKQIDYGLIFRRFLVFTIGLWIVCYGMVMLINANFGVAPWDVLHLGIIKHITWLSFGRVTQLVGVVILAISCLLVKKWPTIGAIANMIMVGEFSDMIIYFHLVPEWTQMWARIGLLIAGIIILGLGTGIYIQSQLGAGPRDWLMLALNQKTGWAIRWVRTLLEILAVAAGIFLGGPFSWGTILFSLTIGHTTELGFYFSKKWLGRYTERREVI